MLLRKQTENQAEHQEYLTGLICSTFVNWSMGKDPKTPPVKASDFMPSYQRRINRTKPTQSEDLPDRIRAMFGKLIQK